MNFITQLANAGINAGDSEELRLHKSLLMLATGLVTLTSVVWLALYWVLGLHLSSQLTFIFQILNAVSLAVYLRSGNFDLFRATQLGLFLFFPFVIQWSIGTFVSASGVILWGLLAPISAILVISVRDSLPWFLAYIVMTSMSGVFDYYLADTKILPHVPGSVIAVFFSLNFIAMSTIIYLMLSHFSREKERVRNRVDEAFRLLEVEQERSKKLLLNILPAPVVERLKDNRTTIADGFADVTVMFADIVNFTKMAEGLSPNQIFSMLNKIFSSFDDLTEKHGLEKIKTIGDAYMVAGGINDESGTTYSQAIVEMALDMRDLLRNDFAVNHMQLEMRIGISTGPVVAGVVGKRKFIYDLWGDTVNIASRLTSEGAPGTIQMDETSHRRLREHYAFEPAQKIAFKGKGEMMVYRLIDRRQGP